jgi:hypothetical protein
MIENLDFSKIEIKYFFNDSCYFFVIPVLFHVGLNLDRGGWGWGWVWIF